MLEENAGISICRKHFLQGSYSNIIFPLVATRLLHYVTNLKISNHSFFQAISTDQLLPRSRSFDYDYICPLPKGEKKWLLFWKSCKQNRTAWCGRKQRYLQQSGILVLLWTFTCSCVLLSDCDNLYKKKASKECVKS